MNLSERFEKYLRLNGITSFSTREALNWYETQKRPGSKPASHTDLSYLIIRPLIYKGVVRRTYIGQYVVVDQIKEEKVDQPQIDLTDEEREFFEYLESKMKGGE